MQVILLQDLYKHGVAGEVVKVADGFARNFLIPRKMAVRATPSALRQTETVRKNVEARRAQYNNMLNDLARQIDGVRVDLRAARGLNRQTLRLGDDAGDRRSIGSRERRRH